MAAAVARAVRFDRYGGRDVLYVADVEMPSPAPGEVVADAYEELEKRHTRGKIVLLPNGSA